MKLHNVNPEKMRQSIENALAILEFQRKGGVIVECKPKRNKKVYTANATKNNAPARMPGV